MAELTIQLSDELMSRLEPLRERLPQLLEQVLLNVNRESSTVLDATTSLPISTPVYTEVLDFLIQRPTVQEIATFKVSLPTQNRLRILLEKNREATLSEEEIAELDIYEQLEHLMILLKARAIHSI